MSQTSTEIKLLILEIVLARATNPAASKFWGQTTGAPAVIDLQYLTDLHVQG
jgi:hypothetical protein